MNYENCFDCLTHGVIFILYYLCTINVKNHYLCEKNKKHEVGRKYKPLGKPQKKFFLRGCPLRKKGKKNS